MFGVKYKCVGGSKSSCSCVTAFHVIVLVFFCIHKVIATLQLTHLFVPETGDLKSPYPIVLECDLKCDLRERQNVIVQWFHDNDLLYMWSQNRTTGVPFVNLNYADPVTSTRLKISNETIHAPVVITNKTRYHTGNYRCEATVDGIDYQSQQEFMEMIAPVDNITLEVLDNSTKGLTVICVTEDVYPEPQIKLIVDNQERTDLETMTDVRVKDNSFYDVVASYTLPLNTINQITKITCTITLSKTTNSRTIQYNKSGYINDDINSNAIATDTIVNSTINAQDSSQTGTSTLNLMNVYLISISVIAVLTLARDFI